MTTLPCSMSGCEDPVRSRNLCSAHYQSEYLAIPRHLRPSCSVEGCTDDHHSRGFCYFHYLRDYNGVALNAPRLARGKFENCLIPHCDKAHSGNGMCKGHCNWAGRYKLSVVQAIQVFEQPDCDLCKRLIPGSGINVDHDHSCCPGQSTCGLCIRGVLCRACNRALGSFDDDLELLRRAATYLGG